MQIDESDEEFYKKFATGSVAIPWQKEVRLYSPILRFSNIWFLLSNFLVISYWIKVIISPIDDMQKLV